MRAVPTMTTLDVAFGNIAHLPSREEIPEAFWRGHTPWNHVVAVWFFRGLPTGTTFRAKPGVDETAAKHAVAAILRSFEPKHEHKEAGAAYLLAEWFDAIDLPAREAGPGAGA